MAKRPLVAAALAAAFPLLAAAQDPAAPAAPGAASTAPSAQAGAPPPAAEDPGPTLWQERYFWDALLPARDKLARQQSDPNMIPVMKAIAQQIAQQVANLEQIDAYAKSQADNLRYAYEQDDPDASLETIRANFETLATGCDQVRQNLYYLSTRERMAESQALPDPEMYQTGLLILGQIQALQTTLNSLYTDTVAAHDLVYQNAWAGDRYFQHKSDELLRSVTYVQDAVFASYNAATELTLRCK